MNQTETPMLGGGRDLDSRNLNSNLQSSGNDSLTKQLLSDDGVSSIKKVSPRKGGNANFYSNIASSQFGPIEEEEVDDELRSPDKRAVTVSSPTKSPGMASASGDMGIHVATNGYSTEKKDPKL